MKRVILFLLATILLGVAACAPPSEYGEQVYNEGTYTGAAEGYAGEITVEVTVSKRVIQEIKILTHSEPEEGIEAIQKMPLRIVNADSVEVDTYTGCTITSNAIQDAVADALSQAKP